MVINPLTCFSKKNYIYLLNKTNMDRNKKIHKFQSKITTRTSWMKIENMEVHGCLVIPETTGNDRKRPKTTGNDRTRPEMTGNDRK